MLLIISIKNFMVHEIESFPPLISMPRSVDLTNHVSKCIPCDHAMSSTRNSMISSSGGIQ